MVELILEKVISWGVPVLCVAIVTYLVKPFIKTHKKGQELEEQEEWDNRSAKMKDDFDSRLSALESHHCEDTSELENKIKAIEQKEDTTQELLKQILKNIQQNNKEFHDRIDTFEKKNTDAFVQIYQRDLIVDGKTYLNNKKWTPNQKSNFKKRYNQYKAWGGNGDIEPWIEKLNRLPVEYPEIEDFVENEKRGDL